MEGHSKGSDSCPFPFLNIGYLHGCMCKHDQKVTYPQTDFLLSSKFRNILKQINLMIKISDSWSPGSYREYFVHKTSDYDNTYRSSSVASTQDAFQMLYLKHVRLYVLYDGQCFILRTLQNSIFFVIIKIL